MKNRQLSFLSKTIIANCLAIVCSLLSMSFTSKTPLTNTYQIVSSKIFIAGNGKINNWMLQVDSSKCEGNFITDGGELEDIGGLRFAFPVQQISSTNPYVAETLKSCFTGKDCNEITFTQKSLMILPIMKTVHMIGEIKIGKGAHNVPMQMQYIINQDQSITLYAKQFVKLSEFGISLPNIKPGDIEEEVTINIALNLKKKQSK